MASLIYPPRQQHLRRGDIYHPLLPIIVATAVECEHAWESLRTSWHGAGRVAQNALVVVTLDLEECSAWLAVKDGFLPLDLGTRLDAAHQVAAQFGLTLDWTFDGMSRQSWAGGYSPRRVGEALPTVPPYLRDDDRELFEQLRSAAIAEPGAIDPMFLKALRPVSGPCDADDPTDLPAYQGGVYRVWDWNPDEQRHYQLCLKHAFEWARPNWRPDWLVPGDCEDSDDDTP
jgi:hypothetical protein